MYILIAYKKNINSTAYTLFLRINVTENNFSHMGNRTHDLGTNCLANRRRTLYHYTKFLSKINYVSKCVMGDQSDFSTRELVTLLGATFTHSSSVFMNAMNKLLMIKMGIMEYLPVKIPPTIAHTPVRKCINDLKIKL